MARGDVLLVSQGRDIWARVIVGITGNPIHHIALDRGDGTAVSAEIDRVKIVPITNFAHVQTVSLGTAKQRNDAAWFAEQIAATRARYNKAAFVLAGASAIGLMPRWSEQLLSDLVDDWGYICSSLVDTCLTAVGIDLLDGPATFTWPGEFADAVLDRVAGFEPRIATA